MVRFPGIVACVRVRLPRYDDVVGVSVSISVSDATSRDLSVILDGSGKGDLRSWPILNCLEVGVWYLRVLTVGGCMDLGLLDFEGNSGTSCLVKGREGGWIMSREREC